jgi:uncharacterized heparinase superfamily protein
MDASASLRPKPKTGGRSPNFKPITVTRPYGNRRNGADLLAGRWMFGGQSIDVGSHGHPFSVSLPSERFADWIHSFEWLADLLSVPGGDAKAGQLAAQWADVFAGSNAFVFAPDLLARRTLYWGLMLSTLTDAQGVLAGRYSAQMRLLRRDTARLSGGLSRLRAQASLVIYGARLLDKGETLLAKALDSLDEEIALQILADGGHVSRSPMATLEALDALLAADAVLQATSLEGSRALDRAIDRMLPMIATLRHTDGGLGLFHGGHEGDPARITALLKARGGDPQPFGFGPHTGYHRLDVGETVVMVDMAGVPARPFDLDAHLAPLAMEISTAEGRLLVNCGWHPQAAPAWRRPVRASAAHSTLTLADRSPGQILDEGFLADALGPAIAEEPENVRARRKEQSSGIWLESSHDGYKIEHGLVHRRRLFVGESGDDVRGEDSLFVPMGDVPVSRNAVPFALRFHFHPDVRVSLAQDMSSALLVQKGRAGWRFRTDGGPLAVEPSVYLGSGARPVKCQQLVISGQALGDGDGQGRENRVRWSLRRLKGRSA